MLNATFNDDYDGIHIRSRFYTESSQLLDVIKNKEAYPNVSGGLLPTVKKEYRKKLAESVLYDLNTVAGMRQIVREVVEEIVRHDEESERLQTVYWNIVGKHHPMRHISELSGLPSLGAEIPPEVVYLRNLYSALPVADVQWEKFRNLSNEGRGHLIVRELQHVLADGIAEYTNMQRVADNRRNSTVKREPLSGDKEERLWEIIERGIKSNSRWWRYSLPDDMTTYYVSKMSETENGLDQINIPKNQLYYDSELHVKEKFEYLIKPHEDIIEKMSEILEGPEEDIREKMEELKADYEDELPPQLFEHIKSIAEKHSHEKDLLILTETVIHKTLESLTRIYIASNDMRFFSPFRQRDLEGEIKINDNTLTQYIQNEFEITCDNPQQILEILGIPLNDS